MDGNRQPESSDLEELIARIARQQKINRALEAEVERLRKMIADATRARDGSAQHNTSMEQHGN